LKIVLVRRDFPFWNGWEIKGTIREVLLSEKKVTTVIYRLAKSGKE